ncbi:MAG TPA: hypothetical protein VIK81_01415 [Patescibacteria group bacterium]
MQKLIYRAATGIATASLLASSFMSFASADVNFEISGNGSGSDNEIEEVEIENETTVSQDNWADVKNVVNVEANTGDNEAEDNTGGDVSIDTGDASANVSVSNNVNSNQASVEGCCPTDVNATISNNGAGSDNEIEDLEVESKTKVYQDNDAEVTNLVFVELESGDNEAEDNTNGDVSIKTGDANAESISVSNNVNQNVAVISGGNGDGATLTFEISGNGADSDNEIEDVEVENEVKVDQDNWADLFNLVKVEAESGDNEAEDNTGGEVEIDTGNTNAKVDVSNWVNFNFADVDACDCIEDITVRIKNNGSYSDNEVEDIELENEKKVYQDNICGGERADCDTIVKVELESGDNEAEDNTVGDDEDPVIETGDANADVELDNHINKNVVGGDLDWDLPSFEFSGGSFSALLLLLVGLSG